MRHLPWPSCVTQEQIRTWEKQYEQSQKEKGMTQEEILKMLESMLDSAIKCSTPAKTVKVYSSGIKMLISALKQ